MPISPKTRQHRKPQPESRENSYRRGYDKTWRKLRDEFLEQNGFQCVRCRQYQKPGGKSFHVDHEKPFNGPDDPLRLDEDNLQVLCPSCHSQKTAKEDGYKSQRHG